METVTARSFREASAEDWETLVAVGERAYVENAGDAFLQMLEAQRDNPCQGWMINNYQHSLQCATRALRRRSWGRASRRVRAISITPRHCVPQCTASTSCSFAWRKSRVSPTDSH